MRIGMVVGYLEGLIMSVSCPYCGLKNCKEHQDPDKFIQMADLDEEEQLEVARLMDMVKGKSWSIKYDSSCGVTDVYLKYKQKNGITGEEEYVYIVVCGELNVEPKEEHECKNPNCTCDGKCKVCKCELEKPKYKLDGDMWNKIEDNDKNLIFHMLDHLEVAPGSTICLGPCGVNGRFIPNLVVTVQETGRTISTHLTLEYLNDINKGC